MNAKLTAETEVDLLRGIEWFDRISLGLGDQFETEFFNALERIKGPPINYFPGSATVVKWV